MLGALVSHMFLLKFTKALCFSNFPRRLNGTCRKPKGCIHHSGGEVDGGEVLLLDAAHPLRGEEIDLLTRWLARAEVVLKGSLYVCIYIYIQGSLKDAFCQFETCLFPPK